MQAQPYLMFEGRTEEALAFYKSALGAEIEAVMRYGDTPETTETRSSGIEGQGDALGVQDRRLDADGLGRPMFGQDELPGNFASP